MNALRLGLILVLMVFLSGCGVTLFVPPEEDAVVDEHVYHNLWQLVWGYGSTGVHALSTKAERRLVLMNKTNEDLKVCAESPAEATQDLNSKFDFEGTLEKIEIAKLIKALSTKVKPAFKRSQGLQFYRDGAFQLCQAYLNGFISKKTFAHGLHPCPHCFLDQLNVLRDKAERIIMHEVANGFYGKAKDQGDVSAKATANTTVTTKTTTEASEKTVTETKKKLTP